MSTRTTAAPAAEAAASKVRVTATVDDVELRSKDLNDPLLLEPDDSTVVALAVTNDGTTSGTACSWAGCSWVASSARSPQQ